MLLVIVALFGICWLPLHVFIVVLDLAPGLVQRASHNPYLQQLFIAIYYTVHWLAMSNSFVNPIIYSFLNESFRVSIWQINAFIYIKEIINFISINFYSAKLIYLSFHPLKVVSRYRDPQLQVAENYSYLLDFSTHICKSWCLETHFIPNNSDFVD